MSGVPSPSLVPFFSMALLALVDGAMCGFRAAAGRSGLIDKRLYFQRAIVRGFGATLVVLVVGVVLAVALARVNGAAAWFEFERAARASAAVYASFAGPVILAILLWFTPSIDLRTLMTVTILGPGTLLRPVVVLVGLAVGVHASPSWSVGLMATYAGIAMLSLERWLGRRLAHS